MAKTIVFLIVTLAMILLVYKILGEYHLIPTYQCGTSMTIQGEAIGWCDWIK